MKVAVITGAGGGLGRVFSSTLAADGWSIVALGRTEKTLKDTIAVCEERTAEYLRRKSHADTHNTTAEQRSEHAADHATTDPHTTADHTQTPTPEHSFFVCDITAELSVNSTFEKILAHYGRLDLLINNAGVPGPTGRIDTLDLSELSTTFTTNVLGAFLCSRAAFSIMEQCGGGRIINNGSIAATSPRPGGAAYAASKAAVSSLTRSLCVEGRGLNIVATELDIGNARTELLAAFTSEEPMFEAEELARLIRAVASLPLSITADQVTLTASGMPFIGRG